MNNATQTTHPNGLITDYAYNAAGLLEAKTETPPAGSPGNVRVTQYSYFPSGLLQSLITPDGITLHYTYDERSRLTSVTDNLNQSVTYAYDDYGNVIRTETRSSDAALALEVDSVFDSRNRLIETRAPHLTGHSITRRILDNNSNLTELIDPNGNSSFNDYDASNRLTENTHRLDGVTAYVYDTLDRVTRVTAPNGVVTRYTYDLLGRRLSETSADRGTLTYGYDLANNLTAITDGRGITATLTYDELERVETKTYPNTLPGKIEDVTYSYDSCDFGLGRLCSRSDESGTTAYEYDAFGNPTLMTRTSLGVLYTTAYVYDDGDNLSQMTLPSGRVIDYTRDGVRHIAAIDTTVNGAPQNIVNNIQYRGDNQITQCTFGNGLIDQRTYDLQGRLTHQLLKTPAELLVDDRSYAYDANSNLLDILTNYETNAYRYDALDRITEDAIDSDSPIDFTYDLNDNRLTKDLEDLSETRGYTYLPASNRIDAVEIFTAGSNPDPVLPDRELIYNDAGRLFQLLDEGILKAEYLYNDQGQRTRKTVYQADGVTIDTITLYHYDRMGYLITETDELGTPLKDYVWVEGMHPVAQIDNQGAETLTYLHSDHLMTARLATYDLQTIVWRWEGEAFGNTAAEEISGVSVNLRFPGQYFDAETNLHYNWHRYYDPNLGRYITSDRIGLAGGVNTYGYVAGNPLQFVDPTGELIPFIPVAVGVGRAAATGYRIYRAAQAARAAAQAARMAAAATAAASIPSDTPQNDECPDDDEFCYQRWEQEDSACWQWANLGMRVVAACQSRAATRRDLCVRNGGKPHPSEPPEYNPFVDYPR